MASINLNSHQAFNLAQIESEILESLQLSYIRAISGETSISERQDLLSGDRCLFWIFASTAGIATTRTWAAKLCAMIAKFYTLIDFSKWPQNRKEFDKMQESYIEHYMTTTGFLFLFNFTFAFLLVFSHILFLQIFDL